MVKTCMNARPSEQMLELLQSGKAVFAVSVGSLWHQIETALEQEEYVDLEAKPLTIATAVRLMN